jgi:hypothetical protein
MSADRTEFRLARVFDTVHPVDGPGFAPGHPQVEDGDERRALAAYLHEGEPVVMTTGLMKDVLDPERGGVVPINIRTDGTWIWTDTVTFYLEEYHLAPEPDLLAHLRAAGTYTWEPDAGTLEAAAAFVLDPGEEPGDAGSQEDVWQIHGT